MKVELIDRLGLKPDTPFLDIFEQADLAFGTTIVAEILTGMAPRLKEAGKVSHDAGDAVIRAATAEFLSDL